MPTSLLLMAASPSPRSRSNALLSAASERLQHLGLTPQTQRLRDLPPQPLLQADFQHPAIQEALQAVAKAIAVGHLPFISHTRRLALLAAGLAFSAGLAHAHATKSELRIRPKRRMSWQPIRWTPI